MEANTTQNHGDIVLNGSWWWVTHLTLCTGALLGNSLFLIVAVFSRKRRDLQTFVTGVLILLAAIDIADVIRIIPVLSRSLFYNSVFRHAFCSLGIFHETAVSLCLIGLAIAVANQAGKESKYISGFSRSSLAHKIFIPVVLILAAGAGAPFFLVSYEKLSYTCTDPFRVVYVIDAESKSFHFDLYSTIITGITYVLPVLLIPITLLVASVKTCISKQCCTPRFKQPIGELIMVTVMTLTYMATVVGVMLPRLDDLLNMEEVKLGPAPLLWELANDFIRPMCYFLMNPGIWDSLAVILCRKKGRVLNSEDEDIEIPLSPITTV